MRVRLGVWGVAAIGLSIIACRGGNGGVGHGGGGEGQGGLSNATSLKCPYPGKLPFELQSHGFQNADAKDTAEADPRSKDESSDTLGNPGGPIANTYTPNDAMPVSGDPVYDGRKARTGNASGLSATPLTGEFTSLWFYDSNAGQWQTFGRATTDADGHYEIGPGMPIPTTNDTPVYSILEADGSCAEHYNFFMDKGKKFVVTDIDGTMTASNDELFKEIDDGSYVPAQNKSAVELMQEWHKKKYPIVYLTARPHLFRAETRAWLESQGFPIGAVISANTLVTGDSARQYKGAWCKRMISDFGWVVEAAYGNELSDAQAYEDAGIPKNITFTINEAAGAVGTTPIQNGDFTQHITDFVDQQPDNTP